MQEIELAEQDVSVPEQVLIPQPRQQGWRNLGLMVKKNFLIYRRQFALTLFLFMSPILVCLLIVLFQKLINSMSNFLIIDSSIDPILDKVPRCRGPNCVSIGYFILGSEEPWIENVMQRVAKQNQLGFGTDVKLISKSETPHTISDYLTKHQNKTQIGVVFCTDKWKLDNNPSLAIPCQFERITQKKLIFYTIIYNYTLLYKTPYLSDFRMAYPKDAYATSLKRSLDNAIMNEFINGTEDHQYLYVSEQSYPRIPNRFIEGIDVAGNYGAYYFFAPYLLNFLVLINELLQEKDKKLRQGLVVMGLSHSTYWFSWVLTTLIVNSIISLVFLITGMLFQFDLFLKTPLPIIFILFNTFGFSISLIGFFISTICPDAKNGYTIAYGFILMAIVMQMFFTQSGMTVLFVRFLYAFLSFKVPQRLIKLGLRRPLHHIPLPGIQVLTDLC